MNRRSFLKATGSLVATASLMRSRLARSADPPATSGRLVIPINRGWRFSRTVVDASHARDFVDTSYDRVVLPHTTVTVPWHSFDENAYERVSSYRRRFRLPAAARGKHVFVDFEGVMTASTIWLNGTRLGEYKGGYTPFSFDLTPHLDFDQDNALVVDVDSSERPDIPPFGHDIDYLTFGGIYREVSLRVVGGTFIANVFARPLDVLGGRPRLEVDCFVQDLEPAREPATLECVLRDGKQVIARSEVSVPPHDSSAEPSSHTVRFGALSGIKLWELAQPSLYTVDAILRRGKAVVDRVSHRLGFREARFTDHGFVLNGKTVKLRGLNRHQTFPFVGQAMPARVQRQDASILRHQLKCNVVRTSHYPQSRHFLDACDEIGLLVVEEIPGWQHIGDDAWKLLALDNVKRMIRRDWNRPSIILWGVRINESKDDHDLYVQTNDLAHRLDPTRQTGGIRQYQNSEFLEDVFTMNDFDFPLKPPNYPRYLNTEFVGHTFPTKSTDQVERLTEHAMRHARIHDQLASDPRYAGGIGWCAFDYNTHANFGSGDRVCYHGVADIFRAPKPAAGFYKSQCDPSEEIVMEPAFHWARGDAAVKFSTAVVCSNCDHIKLYVADKLIAEGGPDRAQFAHLRYPPFVFDVHDALHAHQWGDLRLEGYLHGKRVISKQMSGRGIDQKLVLAPDDTRLIGDGADTTRVVLRVTDEFGAIRPMANDAIVLELDGPASLIGENPFALVGGTGAIWIRAGEGSGRVRLTATHPVLGQQQVVIDVSGAEPEEA